MRDDLVVLAVAGCAAGLGVAMPLGAIGVLILREGMLRGYRSGLAAATGVATVDTLYCLGALLAGAALSPVIASWGDIPAICPGWWSSCWAAINWSLCGARLPRRALRRPAPPRLLLALLRSALLRWSWPLPVLVQVVLGQVDLSPLVRLRPMLRRLVPAR